jgi:GAF domain-containing protein
VVVQNAPLIITDSRENDLVKDSPAIAELDAIGYLGMPLTLSNGMSLGSFCVMDTVPHEWSEVEIAIMHELSSMLTHEFEIRAHMKSFQASATQLKQVQQAIEILIDETDTTASKEDILAKIRAHRATHSI